MRECELWFLSNDTKKFGLIQRKNADYRRQSAVSGFALPPETKLDPNLFVFSKASDKMREQDHDDAQFPGWTPELGSRLKALVSLLGGGVEAGKIAGVSDDMLSRYVTGKSKPSFYAILALSRAAGVSLEWVASGEIPISDAVVVGDNAGDSSNAQNLHRIDGHLFGLIVGAVARLHKELGIRLTEVRLGEIAASKYEEISGVAADPQEQLGAIKLMTAQMRRELTEAKSEPGTGKRSA